MIETDIVKKITDQFPNTKVAWIAAAQGDSFLYVPAENLVDVIHFLRTTWELSFDSLMSLCGVDMKDSIDIVYHLYSYRHKHRFVVKVKTAREHGRVPSLAAIYGAANFQEREAFDLLGVIFDGHPDLRRILLPEDWVGHPLLKDYVEAEEACGISTKREGLIT